MFDIQLIEMLSKYLSSVNNFENTKCQTGRRSDATHRRQPSYKNILASFEVSCSLQAENAQNTHESCNDAKKPKHPETTKTMEKMQKKTRFALIFDDLWLPKFAPIKMRLTKSTTRSSSHSIPDSLSPHSPSVHGRALTALCELPNLMCSS